jgi:hypothetical protein
VRNRPLILWDAYFEPHQIGMGHLPYDFIMFEKVKKWNPTHKLPSNIRIVRSITPDIRPDLLICPSKKLLGSNYINMAKRYNIPLIFIEYEMAVNKDAERLYALEARTVYFSKMQSFGWWNYQAPIIEPCIEVDKLDRGISLIEPSDYKTTLFSCLTEMAKGKCVVAPSLYDIPLRVNHMLDGILYDPKQPNSAHSIVQKLSTNDDLVINMGNNAIKSVSKYSVDSFRKEWVAILNGYFK